MSNSDSWDDDDVGGEKDDFLSMITDLVRKVNWKIAIFLFLIGIFVMSDVFIGGVLKRCNNCEQDDVPTSKGTMVQLMFLSMAYILLDLLVGGEYL